MLYCVSQIWRLVRHNRYFCCNKTIALRLLWKDSKNRYEYARDFMSLVDGLYATTVMDCLGDPRGTL